MRSHALTCDYPGCDAVVREDQAAINGWLTVGGGKRGVSRTDLCGYHARDTVDRIIAAHHATLTKKARRAK